MGEEGRETLGGPERLLCFFRPGMALVRFDPADPDGATRELL